MTDEEAPKPKRPGRWKKGVSGNPGGVGREQHHHARELKRIARGYAEEALEHLVSVMRKSRNDACRIMACKEILDRAYGKPQQTTILDANGGELPTITVSFAKPPAVIDAPPLAITDGLS